jgi:hypothetical protein
VVLIELEVDDARNVDGIARFTNEFPAVISRGPHQLRHQLQSSTTTRDEIRTAISSVTTCPTPSGSSSAL